MGIKIVCMMDKVVPREYDAKGGPLNITSSFGVRKKENTALLSTTLFPFSKPQEKTRTDRAHCYCSRPRKPDLCCNLLRYALVVDRVELDTGGLLCDDGGHASIGVGADFGIERDITEEVDV